jgi:LAS superfamily LD-carboxypeptidase LdcB
MSHAGIGRTLKPPDSTQHGSSQTRRLSVAVALALAVVTLTAADNGLAARSPIAARYVAVMAAPSSTPTAAPSPTAVPAVEASAEDATVVQAAGEVLSDSRYLTTEAAIDTADRDRIMKAASKLRTLVREAFTEPVAPEQTGAAQRTGERSPLPEAATSRREATSRPEATSRTPADDARAAVADEPAAGTGRTSAATGGPVDVRDPDPEPVVKPAAPDEADEAPDRVIATATPTPEDAGQASGSARTADKARAAIKEATAALRTVLDATPAAAVSVKPAPPTPEEIAAREAAAAAAAAAADAAAAAADAAADAERIAQLVAATVGYGNGLIPVELLCELPFSPGQRLRCDAAAHLEQLNAAFAARFGRNLGVSDSYRSYAAQVVTKELKKNLAATPGTSQHGWGLAVDLSDGIQSFGTAEYEWMRANAPALGWDNPDWARQGGAKPEPWHWEYDAPA